MILFDSKLSAILILFNDNNNNNNNNDNKLLKAERNENWLFKYKNILESTSFHT